ncbi:MAG: hypothetical protein ACYTG0_41645 [Planctomycetota bacterium]
MNAKFGITMRIAFTLVFLFALIQCGSSTKSDAGALGAPFERNPGSDEQSTAAPPRPARPVAGTTAAIRALLKSWHPFEERWATTATVILTGTYGRGSYPCIFHGDGSSSMPVRSYFTVSRTIKGTVNREEVDFNFWGLNAATTPSFFVSGRQYMIFLQPNSENMKRLMNPEAVFTTFHNVGRDEIVAIVDLSQGKSEAESFSVKATRTGSFDGFEFTPGEWTSLRNSEMSNVKEQHAFLPFVRNMVLTKDASLKHVRAYLGDPDYQRMSETGHLYTTYHLNSRVMEHKRIGETYCSLGLHFSETLTLLEYSITYFKYDEEENIRGTINLTEEELKERGLTEVRGFTP